MHQSKGHPTLRRTHGGNCECGCDCDCCCCCCCECNCHSSDCGCGDGKFVRRFISKKEKLEHLEEYREELKNELAGLEEHIQELGSK